MLTMMMITLKSFIVSIHCYYLFTILYLILTIFFVHHQLGSSVQLVAKLLIREVEIPRFLLHIDDDLRRNKRGLLQ